MIVVSTVPILGKTNMQIRIIRIYRASQSANHRLIHYAKRYNIKKYNVKFLLL